MNDETLEQKLDILSAKLDAVSAQVEQLENNLTMAGCQMFGIRSDIKGLSLICGSLLQALVSPKEIDYQQVVRELEGMMEDISKIGVKSDALDNIYQMIMRLKDGEKLGSHLRLVQTDETKSPDDDQP